MTSELQKQVTAMRALAKAARLIALTLPIVTWGCVTRSRATAPPPQVVADSARAGTYAVRLCSAQCDAADTRLDFARGVVTLLPRERADLADTVRKLYPYCEGCDDSTFAHVQVCYRFARLHADSVARYGPYLRGVSDLRQMGDSLSFSLGATADAGYVAVVRIEDGKMTGRAEGWNARQLFHSVMVDGHRQLRRRSREEMRALGNPVDHLLGERVGPADPAVCLPPSG